MRKNQRYSKEEMFQAIELWQESGLSQTAFCSRENLRLPSFGYWLRKYRNEKKSFSGSNEAESFIPVNVPCTGSMEHPLTSSDKIEVSFPNGVRLSCPAKTDIRQLKTLINF
jgi:transposase-like protein